MQDPPTIRRALAEVGPRVRRLRTRRDITLTALADVTRISASTLSRRAPAPRVSPGRGLDTARPAGQASRMTIVVRAELRARPGRVEEFLTVARALATASAGEPGTLRYEWFTSADPAVFVVLEEYADPAAAAAHNEHCAPELHRVSELADMTSVHVHGTLGPELEAWVAANPVAHSHPPLAPR